MANEEYKFYRNGEICDSKLEFEDWEMNSPAEWTDTKLFDTLDECCANLFSYDYSGCMGRSPVMFKFDFCFDIGSLLPPIDCQTADIHANVLEDAINLGLGEGSDANITRIGDASLTKVEGSTQCGGSLEGQDFINDLTGTIGQPDLSDLPDSTTVCGVITTESYDCTADECLNDIYQGIIDSLNVYVDSEFTTNLNSLATTRLPPVEELQIAEGITGSLSTYNLLLPSTISSQLGDRKYFKDNDSCGQKTAFATWETKYDTLLDCCSANFNWQLDQCCADGGGCGSNDPSTTTSATTTESPVTTSSTVQTTTESPITSTTSSTVQSTTDVTTTSVPVLRFFADQSFGADKLCNLKPLSEFESWEEPYTELKDCCTNKWSWDYAKCCNGEGLGGCGDPPPTVKYYPTWQDGKLCQSKTSFDGWEVSYDTLEDCCTSTFAYAFEACCLSDGMGGCI